MSRSPESWRGISGSTGDENSVESVSEILDVRATKLMGLAGFRFGCYGTKEHEWLGTAGVEDSVEGAKPQSRDHAHCTLDRIALRTHSHTHTINRSPYSSDRARREEAEEGKKGRVRESGVCKAESKPRE